MLAWWPLLVINNGDDPQDEDCLTGFVKSCEENIGRDQNV